MPSLHLHLTDYGFLSISIAEEKILHSFHQSGRMKKKGRLPLVRLKCQKKFREREWDKHGQVLTIASLWYQNL